jgi:hypothetical protein
MSTARTVSATFAPLTIINILFDGGGQGAIDVTGTTPCTDTCTRFVQPGTPVFLTPNPAPGSVFGEWGGADCAGTPRNESCAFFSAGFGNFSTSVSFLSNPVSVSILGDNHVVIHSEYNGGAGHGTPFIATKDCDSPCDLLVESGTQVTFFAQPTPGIIFNNWLIDCASSGNSSTCFLTPSSNGSIVATSSTLSQSALVVFIDGDVASAVEAIGVNPPFEDLFCDTDTQPCTLLFTPGQQIDLTQGNPGPGSIALGVLPFCGTLDPCPLDLGTAPVTVTSYFSSNTRKRLNIDVVGSETSGFGYSITTFDGSPVTNGSCDGSCFISELDPGLRVTLFPSIGATQGVFFGWGGDCAGFTANQSCEVVMSRNKSATIVYAAVLVPEGDFPRLGIQTDSGSGTGCLSANGPNSSSGCLNEGNAAFPRGASVDLVVVADPGSGFVGFSGDCTFTGGSTIVMDHSCTVFAQFDALTMPPPPAKSR